MTPAVHAQRKKNADTWRHGIKKVVILPDSSGLLPGALLLGVVLGFVAHFFADAPSRVSYNRAEHMGGSWY